MVHGVDPCLNSRTVRQAEIRQKTIVEAGISLQTVDIRPVLDRDLYQFDCDLRFPRRDKCRESPPRVIERSGNRCASAGNGVPAKAFIVFAGTERAATSSGRMMLNILMTFAQYEREIISERTKDKLSASKKKGLYTGGVVVMGYKAVDKKLVIVPEEAELVRRIFQRYIEIQSPKIIAAELNAESRKTKTGKPWTTAAVYRILNNHTYVGEINYKGTIIYEGEHDAIVDEQTWVRTQEILKANNPIKDPSKRTRRDIPLRGIIKCGHCGCPMMPSYAKKKGVTYYYYLCENHEKSTGLSECPVKKVPAGMVEQLVQEQLDKVFHSHDVLVELAARTQLPQRVISDIFRENFWTQVTPAEFTRMAQLILDKVTLFEDHIELDIKSSGMESIMEEFTENDA